MIDKLSNINTGKAQNQRATEQNKAKVSESTTSNKKEEKSNVASVNISADLKIKEMGSKAPIDIAKVSAIKEAISKGSYPIDLDKVADALLQAYKDIK